MSKLFTAHTSGASALSHRIVLAPLTRMRSEMPGNTPGHAMVDYYSQRASEGGLLITEATFIARQGNGGFAAPGIEDDAQVAGWRKVVDAVHAKGAKIFLQLWHVGRVSSDALQPEGKQPIAPSVIDGVTLYTLLDGTFGMASPAREITTDEIPGLVSQYVEATKRARAAGFDGVEVHAANGYLIDQFLQDGSNHRTDSYGGSIENRTRFLLEVTDAVTAAVGADHVGVRVGPSNSFNEMKDSDPKALFSHVAKQLGARKIAYLHVIEPRVAGNAEVGDQTPVAAAMLKPFFGGTIIAAGGFDAAGAEAIVKAGDADLVAFGRHFISNPDLPRRIRDQLPLADYDRDTFYYGGDKGYADYPFAEAEAVAAE